MKRWMTIMVLALLVLGCTRGQPSRRPPIHLQQNMAEQPKYKQQTESHFYADGSAMRMPVEGTVARGSLHPDSLGFYTGYDAKGKLVEENPFPITMELMKRGQQRFNIYCSPCHDQLGTGQGIVVKKGMLPPPSFHEQRLVDTADGHFFEVMTNGLRNMPPYRFQIPVKDRWAIVAYLRALQRSRRATIDDIPVDKRDVVRQ